MMKPRTIGPTASAAAVDRGRKHRIVPPLAKTAGAVLGLGGILITLGALQESFTSQGNRVERTGEQIQEHDKAIAVITEKLQQTTHSSLPAGASAPLASSASKPEPAPTRSHSSSLGSIVQPIDGYTTAQPQVRASGKVDSALKDALFLFVCPELAVQCWPQSPNDKEGLPVTRDGGEWRVIAYLGGPPQKYEFVLYAAREDAALSLSAYLRKAGKEGSHPGLSPHELPAGLTELDRITISKR